MSQLVQRRDPLYHCSVCPDNADNVFNRLSSRPGNAASSFERHVQKHHPDHEGDFKELLGPRSYKYRTIKKPGTRSDGSGKLATKKVSASENSSDDTSTSKKSAIKKPASKLAKKATPTHAQKKAAKPARKPLAKKIEVQKPEPKPFHNGVRKSTGKKARESTLSKLIPAYYESSGEDDTSSEEDAGKKAFTKLVIDPVKKSFRVRKGETSAKIRRG